MGCRHTRGCYDWRVNLEVGPHVDQLGNHGEDRREEMKGWKSNHRLSLA